MGLAARHTSRASEDASRDCASRRRFSPTALVAPLRHTAKQQVVQKVGDLKNEGNKLFAKKEFGRAVEQYELACKLLPDAAVERVDLLSNKAACYIKLRK